MHIFTRLYRIPLFRNIAGAFGGAVIALLLYGVYGIGARVVASVIPAQESVAADEESAEQKRNAKLIETALRAKAIADEVH